MFLDYQDLREVYTAIEQSRLKLYSLLLPVDPELMEPEQKEFADDFIQTEVNADHVKITVKDVLPREAGLPKSKLREHWGSIMHYALRGLNTKYEKVLCVVKIYCPESFWDTDNRAIKIIIDSLRYHQIIPEDRCKFMEYMVIGETNRDNPRTEIYLLEAPQNPKWFIENNENQ